MTEPPFAVINRLPQSVRSKIMNGDGGRANRRALDAMEPGARAKVLAALPDNVAEYTPKYKEEAEKARKAVMEERRAESRKRFPQLPDLLSGEQIADVRSGEKDRVMAVIAKLDPDKRVDVVSLLPPKSQVFFPEYRRKAQEKRTPQFAASEDLKEARIYRAVYSRQATRTSAGGLVFLVQSL